MISVPKYKITTGGAAYVPSGKRSIETVSADKRRQIVIPQNSIEFAAFMAFLIVLMVVSSL